MGSIWSNGSPPVHTTKGFDLEFSGQKDSEWFASCVAELNFPPPGPSVPTKSVSQKLHIADSRSFSNPDHRLQPLNRKKIAGRPVWYPSPWIV